MKRSFWLVAFSLILLGFATYRVIPAVVITNQTGQELEILFVEIAGKRLDFNPLEKGASGRRFFTLPRDSRFMVNYQLADGTSTRFPVGHLTSPSWWSRTQIVLKEGGTFEFTTESLWL